MATLADVAALEKLASKSGRFVGVTYFMCGSGYLMVHEARVRVVAGEIGNIQTVQVKYLLRADVYCYQSRGPRSGHMAH
jgi:predicted dehydrogenase